MPNATHDSGPPTGASTDQLLDELERYAGWLGKDARCSRLRASVKELVEAVAGGAETSTLLTNLQADLKGVGSSAITPLLRRTLQRLRVELGHPSG